jgi:transposase InsO family protein
MSRKGNCWDNACAESFFGHFKNETIHLMKQKPENLKEVIDMVEDYMVYYINERPQRKLGGLTPSLYKKQSNTV